jgi:hypothetical protein
MADSTNFNLQVTEEEARRKEKKERLAAQRWQFFSRNLQDGLGFIWI